MKRPNTRGDLFSPGSLSAAGGTGQLVGQEIGLGFSSLSGSWTSKPDFSAWARRTVPGEGAQPLGSPSRIYSAEQSRKSKYGSHLSPPHPRTEKPDLAPSEATCPAQIPLCTVGQETGSFTCSSRRWRCFWHGRCSSVLPLTLKLSGGWTRWKILVFTINVIYITFLWGVAFCFDFSPFCFPEVMIVHYQLSHACVRRDKVYRFN